MLKTKKAVAIIAIIAVLTFVFGGTVIFADNDSGAIVAGDNGIDTVEGGSDNTDTTSGAGITTDAGITSEAGITSGAGIAGLAGLVQISDSKDKDKDKDKDKVKLELDVKKNGSVSGYESGTYFFDKGTEITLTAIPDPGYEFYMWTGSVPRGQEANPSITFTITENLSINAHFTQATAYTLTVTYAGTGTGSVSKSPLPGAGGKYADNTVVTLTAVADPGSQFAGWSGAATGNATGTSIKMDGNKNVVATFTKNSTPPVEKRHSLTVTYAGTGTGDVSKSPLPGADDKYADNTVVTLTAIPDADSQFAGWSGAVTEITTSTSITMTSDKTVTATFTKKSTPPVDNRHTLTVNYAGTGTGDVSKSPLPGEDNKYDNNTVVTLTAVPNPGSHFTGWSGDATGATTRTSITMDGNKRVVAIFAQDTNNNNNDNNNDNTSSDNTPSTIVTQPTVQVTPEAVPGGGAVNNTPSSDEETATIVDDATPAGSALPESLPKTGGVPAGSFYGLGGILAAAGMLLRKKFKQ